MDRMMLCLETFDEEAAFRAMAEVEGLLGVQGLIVDLLLPFITRVGHGWLTGELRIAQEHFASELVRSQLARLTGPVAGADGASGPAVVLACPPGEHHDVGPLAFGVLLRQLGWRVRFLGADTPLSDLEFACGRGQPDLVVVSSTRSTPLVEAGRRLRRLSALHPLALAGPGASAAVARSVGATWLAGDLAASARAVDELVRQGSST